MRCVVRSPISWRPALTCRAGAIRRLDGSIQHIRAAPGNTTSGPAAD